MKNKMRRDARYFHTQFWLIGLCFTLLLTITVGCNTFTQGTEPAIPWSPEANSQTVDPLLPTPVETIEVVETSSPIWDPDSIPAECSDRPLAAWRFQPGSYTMKSINSLGTSVNTYPLDHYRTVEELDLSSYTPDNEYPSVSDSCTIPLNAIESFIPQPPTSGLVYTWEGTCNQQSEVPRSVSQKWTVTFLGFEERETKFGTLTAIKIDKLNEVTEIDGIDGTSYEQIHGLSWFVCGLGLVYEESTVENLTHNYSDTLLNELLSFTPITTNELRVRYILVDIALGQTADYYRANLTDEETAEALRRWDAGIRVTNLVDFDRKLIDDQWRVVMRSTDLPIEGREVILSTDNTQ